MFYLICHAGNVAAFAKSRLSYWFGGTTVSPPETLNVFNIRLAANCEARSLKPPHAELYSIERNYLDGIFADKVNERLGTKDPPQEFLL